MEHKRRRATNNRQQSASVMQSPKQGPLTENEYRQFLVNYITGSKSPMIANTVTNLIHQSRRRNRIAGVSVNRGQTPYGNTVKRLGIDPRAATPQNMRHLLSKLPLADNVINKIVSNASQKVKEREKINAIRNSLTGKKARAMRLEMALGNIKSPYDWAQTLSSIRQLPMAYEEKRRYVRTALKEMMLQYHPDKSGRNMPWSIRELFDEYRVRFA